MDTVKDFINLMEEQEQGSMCADVMTTPEYIAMKAQAETPAEWIEWEGGECPVPEFVKLNIRTRNGVGLLDLYTDNFIFKSISWKHTGDAGDIIAYQEAPVLPQEDKPAPKKQTLADYVVDRVGKEKFYSHPINSVDLVRLISEYLEGLDK